MRVVNRFRLALVAWLAALSGFLVLLPPSAPPVVRGFGWVRDPAAAESIASNLPCPHFKDTEAFRDDDAAGPEDVFLWDACRKVTGDLLPPRDQGSVGACVGFGTAAAVEHLSCVQVASDPNETFRELAPEIIYAGSRVEIGGGHIRGDGSVGAWAAQFVHDYGVLPRDNYPRLDLSKFDPKQCRRLGNTGVPADLEPLTKQHPVRAITSVRSFDECRAAIRNGYPMIVCSSQGFTMARDAEGFCQPQGTWMHCLAIVGVRGGPRPGAFLLNSWGGSAHRGPGGLGHPSPAGFWADADVVDRMLREGDSWAFSQFAGFPARKLDWKMIAARN
jgi:hypothetical protein